MTIFAPVKQLQSGIDYDIQIKDDGSIIDALAAIDRILIDQPEKTIFPLYKGSIHSYLQFLWDPEHDVIYEDCGIDAYGPNKEYMPLRDDINLSLYPNSAITLIAHAD